MITAIGKAADCDTGVRRRVIDARGVTVAPGLIDSHTHPVFGDWTPRQNQLGWIESCMHGGVTTMISAGEVHLPGRRRTSSASRRWRSPRAARLRGHAGGRRRRRRQGAGGGAPVIEKGMVEQDFADWRRPALSLLGEIGLGTVKQGAEARQMVQWARKHGIQSTIHTGGPSIPGSGLIDEAGGARGRLRRDRPRQRRPHLAVLQGGLHAVRAQHAGARDRAQRNEKIAILTAKHAMELKCPHRVILGTDAPAGSGVQPLGMFAADRADLVAGRHPAEIVFGFATGNTARMRGLRQGLLEAGRPADLVFMDRAQHTAGRTLLDSVQLGDVPGVGMVMIDGLVTCQRSRNTPPATDVPVIEH